MVRITPQDAKGMMDAYAKVYQPKEVPKTDEAAETTASAEAENTEEKTT